LIFLDFTVRICNIIYSMFLSDDWSIYGVSEPAKTFIDLVECNFKYIRFNHLSSRFEIFATAYREQLRIHEYFSSGWEIAVRTFCNQNAIGYVNNTDSKEIDITSIACGLESFIGKKLFGEERDELRLFISNSFGLKSKHPQTTTCNKYLVEYNLRFRIKDGNTQGKRYLEVKHIRKDG